MKKTAAHKLSLSFHAPGAESQVPFLRRHLRKAAQLVASPVQRLSVAIVDDQQMMKLHDQFLGDASTTDVMTFPIASDDEGRVVEGEVVLCRDEAIRCAEARGLDVSRELLLYGVHGLLHLSGYDDTSAAAFRKMHAKEDELLAKMKIGRVFAAPELKHPGSLRGQQ